MIETELSKILARTKLGRPMQEAVHLVLVEGYSITESARRVGVSRSRVRETVSRIKRIYKESLGCPRDWEVVTVCLPKEKAEKIKRWAEKLRNSISP